MLLTIKRNSFESALVKWMNLDPVIQSEVRQKGKTRFHILGHNYGISKNGTDEPNCRSGIETDTERTPDTG